MKTSIFCMSLALLFFTSCGTSNQEAAETSTEDSIQKEIVAIDSAATKMEEVNKEIQESAAELDEQLNNL